MIINYLQTSFPFLVTKLFRARYITAPTCFWDSHSTAIRTFTNAVSHFQKLKLYNLLSSSSNYVVSATTAYTKPSPCTISHFPCVFLLNLSSCFCAARTGEPHSFWRLISCLSDPATSPACWYMWHMWHGYYFRIPASWPQTLPDSCFLSTSINLFINIWWYRSQYS